MRWFLILLLGVGLAGLLVALHQDEPAADRAANERAVLPLEVRQRPPAGRLSVAPDRTTEARRRDFVRDRHERLQGQVWKPDPSTPRQLARATTMQDALRRVAGLPQTGPTRKLDQFTEALEAAKNPLSRQYTIFLAALTVPYDLVEPWLRDLWTDGAPGDRDDAICALAFSGEADALTAFRAFGVEKGIVTATWPLVQVNERRLRRSYRCIEVLDREPYYKIHFLNARIRFLPHPQPNVGMDRALREAWLTRYAGHPGSDDAALRIALPHLKAGDQVAAARWLARAAALPDRDKLGRAARMLVSISELALTPEELDVLAYDQGLDSPNRTLLQYIRLRRIAAGRGCDRAIAVAAGIAMAEPDSLIGYAWHNRWAAPVTRGVNSGVEPLRSGDALLRTRPAAPAPKLPASIRSRSGLEYRWNHTEKEKRNPWPEALIIRPQVLMRQFRAWETYAELERRTRAATRAARGDLLYKQAAVLYHNRDLFFPAYGRHTGSFAGTVRNIVYTTGRKDQARRFEEESFAWLRAIDVFRRIESEAPGYPGMDRVLFSQGIALKRLIDYRPYHYFYWRKEKSRAMVRDLVNVMERCADEHPESPLAPDARRAAGYWRANMPN